MIEFDSEMKELNDNAVYYYGKHQRINKAIEELIELAHVLTKINKLPAIELNYGSEEFINYSGDLLCEIADVMIMLENLMYTFDIPSEALSHFYANKITKFKLHVEGLTGDYR